MMLRIRLLTVVFLLLAGLSGCGKEIPTAVSSAKQEPTAASLTIPVLPTPTAVDEPCSDKERAVSVVSQ